MDPSKDCATLRSDGSGSDGNGGRSVNTSSRRRRLLPSSPTGTHLMSEFNAAADAGGSGSSSSPSSSVPLDLEGVVLLVPPEATDNTIIMEGELLDDDNEPGTPSGTRRSASVVDNNGLGTPSSARRSASADNNGPSNRVSISDVDLVLVSSGSQSSSGGGSRGRRSASNGQSPQREEHRGMQSPRNNRYNEVGSSSRQPAPGQRQRVGPSNIQIQPQHPVNIILPPGFRIPPILNFLPTPPPWMVPGYGGGLRVQLGPAVQGHVYMPQYAYGSPAPSIYPPYEASTMVIPRRSSGLYPPPGVTIRVPLTSDGNPPPPPEPPVPSKVTIKAPPAGEGSSSSPPKQPEQTAPSRVSERASPSAPKQPEATPPAPQPETRPSQPVPLARAATFSWPPIAAEDALFTERLHGPSRRPRLPVFKDICPDDETSQPPPPPPPPTSQSPPPPPPPPPTSQPPPPPPPPPPRSP